MNYFGLDITHIRLIILVFAFIFVVKDVTSQSTEGINKTICVANVDSTKDYYILQSYDSTRKYKIVSRKVPVSKQNIQTGKKYDVTLININNTYPKGLQINNPCDVFFNFGEGNLISNDVESECEIYYCKEFFGLYYTTDDLEQGEYLRWIKNNPIEVQSLRNIFRKGHINKYRVKKKKRL